MSRNPDCMKYDKCLEKAALLNRAFDCDQCPDLELPEDRFLNSGNKDSQTIKIRKIDMEETKTKICNICGEEKELKYFPKNPQCKDGHAGQCSQCKNAKQKERCRLKKAEIFESKKKVSDVKKAIRKKEIFTEDARYEKIGRDIGQTVDKKQAAYGDSFGRAGKIIRELYPAGIQVEQYDDALAVIRIIDKLFRIATDKDAMGEDPFLDIAGYGMLGVKKQEKKKEKGT